MIGSKTSSTKSLLRETSRSWSLGKRSRSYPKAASYASRHTATIVCSKHQRWFRISFSSIEIEWPVRSSVGKSTKWGGELAQDP